MQTIEMVQVEDLHDTYVGVGCAAPSWPSSIGPPSPGEDLRWRKRHAAHARGYLQIDVGSMDEHSTKSDEEYEGLAMRDMMATGPTMSSKLWVKDELTCPGEQHP